MTSAIVFTTGGPVELGECLGSGKRGAVYAGAGDPDLAVKIYRRRTLESGHASQILHRLELMIACPPQPILGQSGTELAWPVSLVYADRLLSRPIGFTMVRAGHGGRRGSLNGTLSQFICMPGGELAWGAGRLLELVREVARVVEVVHSAGHAVPDLKPENFVVALPADPALEPIVTLVDCDSLDLGFGPTVLPGAELNELYCAPEVLSGHPHTREADLFALGELICAALTLGQHPFAGRPREPGHRSLSLPDRVVLGLSPLLGTSAPPASSRLDWIPAPLVDLASRAFGDPASRPTAGEWVQRLDALELSRCPANPRHWVAPEVGHCPWCAYARAGGVDPFAPSASGSRHGKPVIQRPGLRQVLWGAR